MVWTEVKTNQLIEMINEQRFSYVDCAVLLGVKKNAIAGKVSRLKAAGVMLFPKPPGATKKKKQPRRIVYRRSTNTVMSRGREVSVASTLGRVLASQKPKAFMRSAADAVVALQSCQCRWPLGETDQEDFHFCCTPTADEEAVYCPYHKDMSRGGRWESI